MRRNERKATLADTKRGSVCCVCRCRKRARLICSLRAKKRRCGARVESKTTHTCAMCDFRVWLALYREPRDFSSSLTEGESCVGAFFSAHKKDARTISVMNLFSMQEIGLITWYAPCARNFTFASLQKKEKIKYIIKVEGTTQRLALRAPC